MRKIILSLTVLAGVAALGGGASAAVSANPIPAVHATAQVQTVQYRGDWRAREYWRQRRQAEWRRRHEMRRWHRGY